ncbi:MAG TPA: radical SAM protein [Bacteroidales bacterium]|nr:radical SAM protein [Bacteroidales bacterium]HSA43408.1 radical SAM protein [Bacteroidales bacterium]
MKVLLLNPPFVRYKSKNPQYDLNYKLFVLKNSWSNTPCLRRISRLLPELKGIRYGVRAGSRWPWTSEKPIFPLHFPFMLAYTAAFLRDKGADVNLIDAIAAQSYSYDSFVEAVKNENADIAIIECSTPTIDIDVWIAKRISRFTKVALAGSHLNLHAAEMLDKHPYITWMLPGEFIKSSFRMMQSLRPGIYHAEVVEDLDSIPFPYRDFKYADQFFDPSMPTPKPQLQIYGSKGCPFKCTFCLWPQAMYDGIVALRKPESILEEIKFCLKQSDYKSIFFDDDTFNLGTERISKLCDLLKNTGLPWTMMGRIDISPSWLFQKMVDSGCVGMRFGVETFDKEVLKNIRKGIERTDFLDTLKQLSKQYPNLMIHLTMMKDLPGQTEDIHQNDVNILRDIGFSADGNLRNYQLSSCAPFPGTDLYNELCELHGSDCMNEYSLFDGGQDTIMRKLKKRNE